MPEINRSISFDAGIERIVDFTEVSSTPDLTHFLPSESHYHQRLLEVLFPPTIEQSLVESCRPQVHDRELLTPTGFQRAHEACLRGLAEAIEKFAGTEQGEKLKSLMDLMRHKQDLNELRTTLQRLLQQV